MVDLKGEFLWYLAHQEELVKGYNGKVLVIRNREVVGSYDTESEALFGAKALYPLGTFIIQRCSPGETDTTQRFSSRVSFGA